MRTIRIFKFAGFAILGLGFIMLAVFLTMSLWNALIPDLFNGPVLTLWQTAGLFLLSKILLTGVAPGSGRHGRYDWRRKYHKRYMYGCREDDVTASAETDRPANL